METKEPKRPRALHLGEVLHFFAYSQNRRVLWQWYHDRTLEHARNRGQTASWQRLWDELYLPPKGVL